MSEKIYSKRREKLLNSIDGIAIIGSATHKIRSNDTEYVFRQNSNFYYLTGFEEDNSILMLINRDGVKKSVMFVQKKEPKLELWSGKRVGVKELKKRVHVDKIYENEKFEKILKKFLSHTKKIYLDLHVETPITTRVKNVVNESVHNSKFAYPQCYEDVHHLVNKMRLIKDKHEIELIKQAIKITKTAHENAMKNSLHVEYEYELQSLIEHTFTCSGAASDAYTTIVASGDNANTLHYIKNSDRLKDGRLILIDAGCEYKMYASDITRTFPRDGKFSSSQREIYELVLSVQKRVIEKIRPNILRSELQKFTQLELAKGLVELGVLKGSYKKIVKNGVINRYYPHGIGHWMGIDVHDTNPYFDENAKEIELQKGMVLTVEPGLYLPLNETKIPKKFRGIGIRIEDDILITSNGCKNLSSKIVKEADDIEEFYRNNKKKSVKYAH
ncbi:MAG: aminopeptidase P N-terminal domain-containing protein [Campylobacterota bacterium]|nr:aminopeptidase P N-terminal domain-containing protein [Campylobacterota bacterium]